MIMLCIFYLSKRSVISLMERVVLHCRTSSPRVRLRLFALNIHSMLSRKRHWNTSVFLNNSIRRYLLRRRTDDRNTFASLWLICKVDVNTVTVLDLFAKASSTLSVWSLLLIWSISTRRFFPQPRTCSCRTKMTMLDAFSSISIRIDYRIEATRSIFRAQRWVSTLFTVSTIDGKLWSIQRRCSTFLPVSDRRISKETHRWFLLFRYDH